VAQKFTVPISIKQLASAGSDALTVFVNGEVYGRVKIEAGGRISWSDGTGVYDTNLYRDSANTLATDDVLKSLSGLVTLAVNGVPSAALPDGALAVDTANNSFYFRTNGEWREVAGNASVFISDTAPTVEEDEVTNGNLWFNSSTLDMFIRYSDAWVQLTGEDPAIELQDVVDIEITDVNDGEVLAYDSTQGLWVNSSIAGLSNISLNELTDVSIASASVGQVLKWDGTSWSNAADDAGTSINSLDDIGDVTAPTPASGDYLKWNGTAWVNDPINLGTDTVGNYVSDVVAGTAITVTHTPGEGSSASVTLNASLNDLNDVVVGAPEEFQTLAYDGAGWVPTYAPVVSYVRNAEATTLTTGTVVYLFGGTGDHASVKRADNSSDTTSSKTIGLVGASIASSENGPIITRGYIDGINTSTYSVGDVLWLGTNGQVTTTKPSAPQHLVFIGVVVRSGNNGIVYVATQNGYEIEELHDVKISSVSDGQFLKYNSASAVWVNDTIDLSTIDFLSPFLLMGA
jgi:hypothetical protein